MSKQSPAAYPDWIDATERQIIDLIITAALAQDLLISVHDGEEWALAKSDYYTAITNTVAQTEMTTLRLRAKASTATDPAFGSVTFIHGNGCDVLSDWTDEPSMVTLLAPAMDLSEQLSAA